MLSIQNKISIGSVGDAAFSPLDLSPSLWLESGNVHYTLDPTNISSWNATVGNDATQSVSIERPSDILISSKSFVQFDETNKEHLDMNSFFNATLSGDFTTYYIIKPDTLGINFQFVLGELYVTPIQFHYYHYFHSDNTFYVEFNINNTTIKAQTTTAFSTANTYIIEVNHDTAAQQINIYVNGVKETLDATNNGDTSTIDTSTWSSDVNMFLGARNNNGVDDLHGDNSLGDILFFDKLLTAQDRADLGNFYA